MYKKKANVELDYTQNTLKIDCYNGNKAIYVTGNKPNYKLVHRYGNEWEVKRQTGSSEILSPNDEYVLASCDKSETFDIPIMKPRFNSKLHQDALENTKKYSGKIKKPMMIFHIALDSLSRRHFIRKLPKTTEFLNSLNQKPGYKVFDFKIQNIQEHASIENQCYIYSGINFAERARYKNPYPNDL